jgi:two-component system, OmpR family, sensor histidine kinase TctE
MTRSVGSRRSSAATREKPAPPGITSGALGASPGLVGATQRHSVFARFASTSSAAHAPSLRRRLLLPLLWGWLIGLGVAVGGAYLLARHSANTAFDRALQDEAAALAAKVTWSERGPLLDVSRQTLELLTWDSADRNSFVMVDLDGNALAGDAAVPLPESRGQSFKQPLLFESSYQGEPVRGAVFSVTSPMIDRSVSIVVVETKRKRTTLMRDLQIGLVLPTLLLGVLTFVLLGLSVRRGLRPLRELGDQVTLRDVHDWRPLPLHDVPAEVVPLIERINQLLHDVQDSVASQKRFVADAAHQLRTPVAGIRVLAQELERELAVPTADGNTDAPHWQPLLTQLRQSGDRLARLIGQLLSLARSESELTLDGSRTALDIVPLLREATEPLVLQGLRSGRSIELDAPATPVMARAHAVWLGEAINNLLDNAQRYGGERIVLRAHALPAGGAEVVVEDNGAGVEASQLPRLFEPFWRGERADLRNDGGTGLGLAIAREIVQRLGGSLVAQTRPEFAGMRFVVTLVA